MTDHAATLALVDAMKSRGVRSFAVGDVRVEFAPPEPAPLKDDKKPDAEECPCGHGLHAHNAGLCLLGCALEKCSKEAA